MHRNLQVVPTPGQGMHRPALQSNILTSFPMCHSGIQCIVGLHVDHGLI